MTALLTLGDMKRTAVQIEGNNRERVRQSKIMQIKNLNWTMLTEKYSLTPLLCIASIFQFSKMTKAFEPVRQ